MVTLSDVGEHKTGMLELAKAVLLLQFPVRQDAYRFLYIFFFLRLLLCGGQLFFIHFGTATISNSKLGAHVGLTHPYFMLNRWSFGLYRVGVQRLRIGDMTSWI